MRLLDRWRLAGKIWDKVGSGDDRSGSEHLHWCWVAQSWSVGVQHLSIIFRLFLPSSLHSSEHMYLALSPFFSSFSDAFSALSGVVLHF